MKRIIRLTESDLHRIIRNSVSRVLKEDILGNDWRQGLDGKLNSEINMTGVLKVKRTLTQRIMTNIVM